MLNIKFEGNGKQAVIMASGSLGDILAELCMTVSDIYKQMKKSAPPVAEEFRRAFTRAVVDHNGPMWNGELKADFGMMGVMPVKQKDGDGNV